MDLTSLTIAGIREGLARTLEDFRARHKRGQPTG